MKKAMMKKICLCLILCCFAATLAQSDEADYRLYYTRAWQEYNNKNYSEAEAGFKKALQYAPTSMGGKRDIYTDLLYNLGNAYFMQQNVEAAAETWRAGLRRKPDDQDMLYNYTVARTLLDEREGKQNEQKEEQQGEQESAGGQQQQNIENQNNAGAPPQQQDRMSEEEALRLLRSLQEQERRQSARTNIIGDRFIDRDW